MVSPQRMPSLVALRCFEAAARLESFSRAADELHLTHGAISRAVRAVEQELGAPLFERRNRRVFLNAAGRLLFDGVHAGLAQMARAAEAVRRQVADRPLLLSCEPTLLVRWLMPATANAVPLWSKPHARWTCRSTAPTPCCAGQARHWACTRHASVAAMRV